MRCDPGSTHRPDPLAYFLTWTTYGSWLPGDDRGWVDRHGMIHGSNPVVRVMAASRLTSACVSLTAHQRGLVVRCVAAHANIRGWKLHAVQCRVEHVHVVVSAVDRTARDVIVEFKAWSTRALVADAKGRARRSARRWWTKGGSGRSIYDEKSLENVIAYVRECQDRARQ